MSFRDNLQYLRAQRNFTQERLAMLLGVSRQAISKWESGKAYPEMDKLLMICDLFGCTLDDLVLGDVRAPRSVPDATPEPADGMSAAGFPEAERGICNGGLASDATSSNTAAKQSTAYGLSSNVSAGQQAVSVALPEDLTGYDAHMNSFAWKVAAGIAAIIAGVAVGVLFDSEGTVSGLLARSEFLTFVCTIIGVIIGLAFLIPAGMTHSEFVRRHPFIEDFYTDDDRSRRAKELAVGVVGGIGLILLGVAVTVYGEETLGIEEGWPVSVMLLCVAAGVFCFIYFGIRYGMMNIDSYNHEAESERREREREAQGGDFYDKLTGLVCGIIMLIATVVGLWMLFTGGPIDGGGHERWLSGNGLFWLAWPIGGILCGVATCIIQIFRSFHDRDR
ncbi:transcriptional regulator [Bifidobacterium pullorum subsp. saeculare DSM 6531 = LMG 14934]|uniref:Transcriptional regulator n=1 Tax=Bifidobacterium pullorum subsp. saeculare DSM 6531 = LMG 14934 TaxID=1437611 RepID=A0A087CZH1_9BIFI|nr:helix-turn-helix transcriptional regulator [Bifidobacterium pullorum]KFI88671.1 transcriptional regulator [Bifidobacterium pullorum subsp. saeculare DSM 6531 = LMG 14934]